MSDPLRPDGVRYWGEHGGPVDAYDDYSVLRAVLNPSRVALCMLPGRIGVRSFVTFLEYTYFPPHTPMNEHFRMAWVTWEETKWLVVIIHKMHLEKADKLAKLVGLRRADGVPTIVRALRKGEMLPPTHNYRMAAQLGAGPGMVVETFPLDGPNVWTMENVEGHFTYGGNSIAEQMTPRYKELERKAREFENRACDQLIEEHRRKWRGGEFDHEPGTQPPRRI